MPTIEQIRVKSREVSKDEFYAIVGPLDVHPAIISDHSPYTSEWKFPRRPEKAACGWTVDRKDGGRIITEYRIANTEAR